MSTQSPIQEAAERVAEAAPGLAVAAHMEAVQNFRQANADYRRRLKDSHQWQAESLGMSASSPPEEDDVGNLIVTGDVYGRDAAEIIRSLQGTEAMDKTSTNQTDQSSGTATSGLTQNLGKAALIAASLLGGSGIGAGVPWLLGAFNQSDAVVQADQQAIGVEVVSGGASQ